MMSCTELFDLFDAHFWAERYRIWTLKGAPPQFAVESLLLEQNSTLIYLRDVKSFVFRAGRKVTDCQRATAFRLPQGYFDLFPSNACMASARSFNTFNCVLQIMLQGLISTYTWPSAD